MAEDLRLRSCFLCGMDSGLLGFSVCYRREDGKFCSVFFDLRVGFSICWGVTRNSKFQGVSGMREARFEGVEVGYGCR